MNILTCVTALNMRSTERLHYFLQRSLTINLCYLQSIERKKVQGPAPPDSPAVTLRNGYLKQYSVPGSPASPCSLAPTDVMASLHMHASQDMPIAELDSRDTLSSR